MAKYNLVSCDSKEAFLDYAVSEFKTLSQSAIEQRGKFSVVLSGGNTPKVLFEALAQAEIDWSKIYIYWGDERYVSHSDPDSNFGAAQRILLSKIKINPNHVYPIPVDCVDPHAAAKAYEEIIKNIRFDLCYLGLGLDGHTASLFPGISLPVNTQVSAFFVPRLGVYRISLMPVKINESREIRFLVSGTEKKAMLENMLQTQEGSIQYPAQLIRACTILAYGV